MLENTSKQWSFLQIKKFLGLYKNMVVFFSTINKEKQKLTKNSQIGYFKFISLPCIQSNPQISGLFYLQYLFSTNIFNYQTKQSLIPFNYRQ